MVADRLAQLPKGGDRGNQYTGGKVQYCTLPQGDAADMLNVSRRAVVDARKVRERGIPELTQLVDNGQATAAPRHLAAGYGG
jgi:hypothetical protein